MPFNLKPSLFFPLLLVGLCSACYPDYRECPCSYQDTYRRFYSQALTEIVEHELYPTYLADVPAYRQADTSDLYLLHANDSTDHRVIWYKQQLAVAQNRLFRDTAHFQTIYLDTTSQRAFAWAMRSHGTHDDLAFWQDFITRSGFNPPVVQLAIDSLCTLQQAMAPQDFQTCTFWVKLAAPHQRTDTVGTIGVIYLSKPLFDAGRQRALLAYNYHCGPRCGFTQVVLLENRHNRWRIRKSQIMSIY